MEGLEENRHIPEVEDCAIFGAYTLRVRGRRRYR